MTHVSMLDYGECCPPYECVDNRCGREAEPCTELGGTCKTDEECCESLYCDEYVCSECKSSGSCTPGADTCCEGYRCWNFKCTPEDTCEEAGDKCDTDADCCDELLCRDGVCRESGSCAEVSEMCGDYANGLECCEGGFCYMGMCEAATAYLCSDEEQGPDYYSSGSATGVFDGTYGTYIDYCINDNTVGDYYCQVNLSCFGMEFHRHKLQQRFLMITIIQCQTQQFFSTHCMVKQLQTQLRTLGVLQR